MNSSGNTKLFFNSHASSIGEVLWVNSEEELDIATVVASSGAGLVFALMKGMRDAGEKLGLSKVFLFLTI